MKSVNNKPRFSPSLCVTHSCNLDCIYCYQEHDSKNRMSLKTAKDCIDWIFNNIPENMSGVEVTFIGGEPLIEFELLKDVYEYTKENYSHHPHIFYATTNGVLLDDKMKEWFSEHKNEFVLGLSLDGLPEVHNKNRSNSFNKIDIDFFKKTWPEQGVKMTLSDYSLDNLASNIIFIHNLGFKQIDGVNLFEGTYDWSDEKYIRKLIPELKKLVEYYANNNNGESNQMMSRYIDMCEEINRQRKKWCGIGVGTIFFDTDGTKLPCPFCTPMTFDKGSLENILETDFENNDSFIDDACFEHCYIFPVCPFCPGANYLVKKSFKQRDKSKCRVQKLITLYCADLYAKKIINNKDAFQEERLYNIISAIEKIKKYYMPEFKEYWNIM